MRTDGRGTDEALAAEPPADQAPPTRLGRYALQEQLGAGGMGTVYAAWDAEVGRKVAVKLLHAAMADGGKHAQRFLQERQVLGALEHPHIARLLDAGETEAGRPWFALEFVDGQPIDEYCDARRLSTRARLEVFLPVLSAVAHAHQHLVVHRDLKPGNILVDAQGAPRLVDFGIARLLQHASPALTQTGLSPMTPAYASPEQVRGEPAATTSDVYSLGVVLYELLTGVSPYQAPAGDVQGLLDAVREAEAQAPSLATARATDEAIARRGDSRKRLRHQLEGDLDAIVLMALRKDPRDRYPLVQALADDLRAALDGRPTRAHRSSAAYRATRFARRHRVAVTALAAGFLAMVGGLVSTAWQARRAEQERDLAQRRYQQVRALAHSVLFDYHDGIAALPGSTRLRERLVQDAQAYLDRLSGEAQGDLSLRREIVRGYLKLSDVQGDPANASLGRLGDAKASTLRAQALAEAVLADAPGDWEARVLLATGHQQLGALLMESASSAEALAEFRRARALGEALTKERPQDLEPRLALAQVDTREGQVLRQGGQLDEAAALLERALAVQQEALKARGDLGLRRDVAVTHKSLGDVRQEQGRVPEAIAQAAEAERLLEALVKEHPDNAGLRRTLTTVWSALAGHHRLAGDDARAVAYGRKDVAASRAAVARDPHDAVAQRDLIASLANLLAAVGLGNAQEAPPIAREALELQRALCASAPDNRRCVSDLAQLLLMIGVGAAERGEAQAAELHLQELVRLAAATSPDGPDAVRLQEAAAVAHLGLAGVRNEQGRFDEAIAQSRLALAGLGALLEQHPDHLRMRGLWVISLSAEGEVRVKQAQAARPEEQRAAWQLASSALQQTLDAIAALEAKGAATAGVLSTKEETLALVALCQKALGTPTGPHQQAR